MGIQDLQTLVENEAASVDLFRIGRTQTGGLRLVLDAEGCLDRLYGGFFSDWACGGQWARCVQFLTTLGGAMSEHRVSMVVCFNGTHPAPPAPPTQWLQQQASYRQKANNVLRHIATKGTPPPKVWWVPPAGLHTCLRTALRYLSIPIMVSFDDHPQEVVALCRERGFQGLVACSGEYLVFQPPRYFSSSLLKLTYRSSLETKEYQVNELASLLDVPPERLCLVAALLGNHVLTEDHLNEFYKRLGFAPKKTTPEALIKSVCTYVRGLPSSDTEVACADVFGEGADLRAAKFRQAVQYYVNGTQDGFLKYKTATARRPKNAKKGNQNQSQKLQATTLPAGGDLDTSKLASDCSEHERKGFEDYKLATANAGLDLEYGMEGMAGVAPLPQRQSRDRMRLQHDSPPCNNKEDKCTVSKTLASASTSSQGAVGLMELACPGAPPEVMRTCAERHARGLMTPQLLAVLTHRALALPVLLEDDQHREIPSVHHFYRPVRQNVYAILFNLHHHKFMSQKAKENGEKVPEAMTVHISEWLYSKQNPGNAPEVVPGVLLDWPVPTVQRLWFGTAQDDKRRRLRAFLSCMRSDSPLMLNTSFVPQHLLILATTLRYIMTSPVQILRQQELDAFLATAFSPELMNPMQLQEMTVSGMNARGVQLGTLVMAGVETALLANDACGAPVPWLVTAPWLYYDGKLFQRKLAKTATCKHLVQLCDNHVEVVMKVERMRKAILEGLDVEFAMPPLPLAPNILSMGGYPGVGSPGGVMGWGGRGGGGGASRGGARLEIAGVVVGQWGGSYATRAHRYAHQVSYVGYTPMARNSYGARYGGGGGRGNARRGGGRRTTTTGGSSKGGRGGRAARPARTPRTTRHKDTDAPAKPATLAINGKTVRSDDIKYPANGSDSSSSTDDSPATLQLARNDDNAGAVKGKGKAPKKGMAKGKKKTVTSKSESDANGSSDNKKVSPVDKVSSPVYNGEGAGAASVTTPTNGDHQGQGDN